MSISHSITSMIVLLLAALFITSCGIDVYTIYPVSESSDLRDRKLLEGAWVPHAVCIDSTWVKLKDDLHIVYLVAFDNKGVMHVGLPEWDDEDQKFVIDQGELATAWIGEKRYLSLPDGPDVGEYQLMLGELQDDVFTICPPNEDLFKDAIDNKDLSGDINYTYPDDKRLFKIKITATLDELKAFLINNDNNKLFDCECGVMKIKKNIHNPHNQHSNSTSVPKHVIFDGCNGSWTEIKKCAEDKSHSRSNP